MNMKQWWVLAVLSLPVMEIFMLIQMVSHLGFFMTLGLLLGAAVLGGYLLQNQGLATWFRFNEALRNGEPPTEDLLNGCFIAIGGGLLLLPGFLSDLIAILCLIPYTRRWLVRQFIAHSVITVNTHQKTQRHGAEQGIIEGEYREMNEASERVTRQKTGQ